VTAHHGQVIKTVGDAFLVDFPSVVHAVPCAQRILAQFHKHNAEKEKTEQIHVRIGIRSGDIIRQNGDVLGDGVNVASRLQALAEPDTICLSHVVYREVEKKLALGTVVFLGRPKLKNITQRQPVYTLLSESPQGLRRTLRIQRLQLSRRSASMRYTDFLTVLRTARTRGYRPRLRSKKGMLSEDAIQILLPNGCTLSPLSTAVVLGDVNQITHLSILSDLWCGYVLGLDDIWTLQIHLASGPYDAEAVMRECPLLHAIKGLRVDILRALELPDELPSMEADRHVRQALERAGFFKK
jgi:adenylate/guanylate cyclase family protein